MDATLFKILYFIKIQTKHCLNFLTNDKVLILLVLQLLILLLPINLFYNKKKKMCLIFLRVLSLAELNLPHDI